MDAFTIKDLENLSGIKAHTIRIWEQRYSFLKPQRTNTNIRYYSGEQLIEILNIALLNKHGYKISEIDRMNRDEIKEKILSLSQSDAYIERLVNDLITTMISLEMDKFEGLLDDYIQEKGIENAIKEVVFPFLERIGILWQTNHINPAQEHLVSNIIRQKIIAGINSAKNTNSYNSSVLLFLPEGEHHELGLLFLHFLLKTAGVQVIYVGADIPLSDVKLVANLKKPDYLFTHLTSVAHNFNLDKFLLNFRNRMPDFKLILSGIITKIAKTKPTANVYFKHSMDEIIAFIGSISK